MKSAEVTTSRFVVCINNDEYPASLEIHKIYRVLPDEDAATDGDIRVVDESGEDYCIRLNTLSPSLCRMKWKHPFYKQAKNHN